jgi:hypothetical protein
MGKRDGNYRHSERTTDAVARRRSLRVDTRFFVILLRAANAALFAFLAAVFNVDFGFLSSLPLRRPRLRRQWQVEVLTCCFSA